MTTQQEPENERPIFPTTLGETVTYTARSGSTVELTLVEADLYQVRLPEQPRYLAALRRDGLDAYTLAPADGVAALGGTGIYERELWEMF